VALVQGTNIVKKELGLPEAPSLATEKGYTLIRSET
jgi:hypothetical protein